MPTSIPSSLANQTEPIISDFAAALRQRIGKDRFEMWFARSVDWAVKTDGDLATVQIIVAGEFALDRMRKNYVREIRAAASSLTPVPHIELVAAARRSDVQKQAESSRQDAGSSDQATKSSSEQDSEQATEQQSEQATNQAPSPNRRGRPRRRVAGSSTPVRRSGAMSSINDLAAASIASATQRRRRRSGNDAAEHFAADQFAAGEQFAAGDRADAGQPALLQSAALQTSTRQSTSRQSASRQISNPATSPADAVSPAAASPRRSAMTMDNFIAGSSSALAHTAASMVCSAPTNATMIYFSGPSGVGKSHLLAGITDTLRRRHRMRSVLHISAEQFTNDFVAVVGKSAITHFRTRYRQVDALLVDDVHFLAGKKATMREFVQTIQHIAAMGSPIVLAGATTPHETDGFTAELAGRMTSGLVCPLMPLCDDVRRRLLMRYVETRCPLAIENEVLDKIVPLLPCDGRMISGVANAIHLIQRMNGRSPTWTEVKTHCSHLLRGALGEVNMKVIERAVCELFNLESGALRSGSQSRRVSQPRMLAMYLSRQKTSSAYSEIAKHYNVRSHTTAMSAERNVEKWLSEDKSIGRGPTALTADQAIEKIESVLRRHA